jgi:hypothetical protein
VAATCGPGRGLISWIGAGAELDRPADHCSLSLATPPADTEHNRFPPRHREPRPRSLPAQQHQRLADRSWLGSCGYRDNFLTARSPPGSPSTPRHAAAPGPGRARTIIADRDGLIDGRRPNKQNIQANGEDNRGATKPRPTTEVEATTPDRRARAQQALSTGKHVSMPLQPCHNKPATTKQPTPAIRGRVPATALGPRDVPGALADFLTRLPAAPSNPQEDDTMHRQFTIAGLTAAVLGATLVACTGTSRSAPPSTTAAPASTTSTVAPGAASTSVGDAAGLQQAFVTVVNKVRPSVVEITTATGLGSGVIYDTKGDIVTNNHGSVTPKP